jgi:hypothetical protein
MASSIWASTLIQLDPTVRTTVRVNYFAIDPYAVPQGTALRDIILNTVLSSHDIDDIVQFIAGGDREFNLDVIDSVWDLLDNENGGGGPARWSIDYLRATLLIDRCVDRMIEVKAHVWTIQIVR